MRWNRSSHVTPAWNAESFEFLRIFNIYQVETQGATWLAANNRQLVIRMVDASSGPTLTLPEPALDDFMTRWEDSNRRVAREFVGDEQLFRVPRKSKNTTAEQHLDPTRLDHFLNASKIPKHVHGPWRALTEREAKGH